jgi:hypothetical protein
MYSESITINILMLSMHAGGVGICHNKIELGLHELRPQLHGGLANTMRSWAAAPHLNRLDLRPCR